MMIANGDGTYMGGPLDVVCILLNIQTGFFHPAFFEESPFPGPVPSVEDTKIVRLKSSMHHSGGYLTIEEAVEGLEELCSQIKVDDANSCQQPIPWDGETGIVWIFPNWKQHGDGTFLSVLGL